MDRTAGPSAEPPRRPRRWPARLAAAALSSCLALLAAELAARALFGVPLAERLPIVEVRANPTRGYEMVPDRDHFTYLHPVHVNRLGLRGPDLPEKSADECRILCLGDSLVYGQGVSDADTIPVALEAELRAHALEARRIARVVNGGVRGYDTVQERAMLEELGDRIRPDVVLLFWFENDLEKPRVESACAALERSGPVAYDTEETMQGWAVFKWHVRQLVRSSALVVRVRHLVSDLTFHELPPAEIEAGLVRLDADLARMAAYARERSIPFVVVALPTAAAVLEDRHEEDGLRTRVRALAEARGLVSVDPTPELRVLRREIGALPVLPYDGHYDGRANRAIARRLAPVLQEIVPGRL